MIVGFYAALAGVAALTWINSQTWWAPFLTVLVIGFGPTWFLLDTKPWQDGRAAWAPPARRRGRGPAKARPETKALPSRAPAAEIISPTVEDTSEPDVIAPEESPVWQQPPRVADGRSGPQDPD